MRLWNLIKRDYYNSIVKRRYKLIIIFAIFWFSCSAFDMNILSNLDDNYSVPVLIDYYLYATRAMAPYKITSGEYFTVPIYWFLFYILLAYHIGDYAKTDMFKNGKYVMMKGGTRVGWLISKVIWCISSVIVFFFVALCAVTFYALFHGISLSFVVSKDIMALFSSGIILCENKDIIMFGIVLPFLIAVALSIMQMIFGLIIDSSVSYFLLCALYIFSAYYANFVLLPNYTMWVRNDMVSVGSGIHTSIGISVAFLITFLSLFIGAFAIANKDIM